MLLSNLLTFLSSIIRCSAHQTDSGQKSSTGMDKQKYPAIPMVVIVKDSDDENNGTNLTVSNEENKSSGTAKASLVSQNGMLLYVDSTPCYN